MKLSISSLRPVATVVTMLGTAYFLVGDSAEDCPHEPQTVAYAVTGNCGAEGTLTVSTSSDESSCDISVATSSPDTRLPTQSGYVERAHLDEGEWYVSGEVELATAAPCVLTGADAGPETVDRAALRFCTAARRDDDRLALTCRGYLKCSTNYRDDPAVACEAVLTRME